MRLNLSAGLLVGFFATMLLFGLHFLGQLRNPSATQVLWTVALFHGLTLVVTLWRHRSQEPAIPFMRLFAAGLLISLVAALVTGAGHWILLGVDPGFLDWVKEQALEQLATYELEPEQRAIQEQAIRASTPGSYVGQTVMAVLMRGLLLSLPIAALLRLRALKSLKDGDGT